MRDAFASCLHSMLLLLGRDPFAIIEARTAIGRTILLLAHEIADGERILLPTQFCSPAHTSNKSLSPARSNYERRRGVDWGSRVDLSSDRDDVVVVVVVVGMVEEGCCCCDNIHRQQ